ncbi:MAG: bifunctional DNA-formamidopyrimidine glycosylase/DNA-(apurinic or apyrimidinic site) lyase [Chlamydiota bacterium]
MPELPEVTTVVEGLKTHGVIGCTIEETHLYWEGSLASPSPAEFIKNAPQKTILDLRRRGKYIVLELSEGYSMLIHLRMTGQLNIVPSDIPHDIHDRVILLLNDGRELRFSDARKFGKLWLTKNPEEILDSLGIEPLEDTLTPEALHHILHGRRRLIKPLLLDQHLIAGLGNIYVDEALWRAKIHPQRLSNTLSESESKKLCYAIKEVLRLGIKYQGTTLGKSSTNFHSVGKQKGSHQNVLQVFRRQGLPCPECQTEIIKIVVGQRSTYLCPQCQNIKEDL